MKFQYCKEHGLPFFINLDGSPREAKDLNRQQLILLKWINFFDWVYSLSELERPSEEIISDDEALDSWCENYRNRKINEIKGDKRDHHFEIGDD